MNADNRRWFMQLTSALGVFQRSVVLATGLTGLHCRGTPNIHSLKWLWSHLRSFAFICGSQLHSGEDFATLADMGSWTSAVTSAFSAAAASSVHFSCIHSRLRVVEPGKSNATMTKRNLRITRLPGRSTEAF